MAIDTTVSASIRRPGRFFDFNIISANRGLTPLTQRIALIGTIGAAGTVAADTLKQIFSETEADNYWGIGSELALMCRWSLKAARDYGKSPEIWAIGMADPGGTAQTYTLTFTGTATASGDLHIRVAGRDVHIAVTSGDAAATVAAACEVEIDALVAELPVTAGIAAAVVTTTHVTTGVNGGDVEIDEITTVAGISLAIAGGAAGATATDITASLALLEDKNYDVVACANHASADVTDFANHLTATWASGAKRWRHTLMAERGSLATGQALATAADDYKQVVVQGDGFRNTPGEIAAYVGTILAGEDDPALPFNDLELPSLYLPEKADIPTDAELETYIAGGLFMLSVNEKQTRARIVRAVTTKVTENSVAFFDLLDYTISRSMYYTARQIDVAQGLNFARAKKTARVRASIRSVTLDVLYALEELEIVQNVDDHKDELVVETDPNVATRVNVAVPTSVVPPLNQVVDVINLLIE